MKMLLHPWVEESFSTIY